MKKQHTGIFYLMYLLAFFALLLSVITYESGYISPSNIYNFIDFFTVAFIIFVCLLSLVCTKTLAAFKNNIMFVCGKRELTQEQSKNGILAVKITAVSAVSSSCILSIVQIVNVLKSMDIEAGVNMLGPAIGVVLLSWFYGMLICMVILPMYAILKQSLNQK